MIFKLLHRLHIFSNNNYWKGIHFFVRTYCKRQNEKLLFDADIFENIFKPHNMFNYWFEHFLMNRKLNSFSEEMENLLK
jgi:hypothetical protein